MLKTVVLLNIFVETVKHHVSYSCEFEQVPYDRIDPCFSSNSILDAVESQVREVRGEMCLLYSDSTVQEWVDQHVTPVLEPLHNLLRDIETVLNEMGLCTESIS